MHRVRVAHKAYAPTTRTTDVDGLNEEKQMPQQRLRRARQQCDRMLSAITSGSDSEVNASNRLAITTVRKLAIYTNRYEWARNLNAIYPARKYVSVSARSRGKGVSPKPKKLGDGIWSTTNAPSPMTTAAKSHHGCGLPFSSLIPPSLIDTFDPARLYTTSSWCLAELYPL
jgi:hypothetical protein